jgi:hypothetical protein
LKADSHVIVLLSYPEEGSIKLLALDKNNGTIDASLLRNIKVGSKPSHIAIDGQRAIISDQGSSDIHELDLSNMTDVWQGNISISPHKADIGISSDFIHIAQRDFGSGLKSYALILETMGSKTILYNLTDRKIEGNLDLSEHPLAAYFPSQASESCCDGEKNWFAVASAKGKLIHVAIKPKSGNDQGLSMNEVLTVDLTSEKNLSLSQLSIIKIIGGKVIFDPSLKREKQCGANNRKMFLISSFARDKHYSEELLSSDTYEVEAQGQSCEGDGTASRFGSIENEPRARTSAN